jgi:GTP-binding protein EngB required for normal cell division
MKTDLEVIERLELAKRNYLIILTKCDKINKKAIADRKQQLEYLVSQCKYAIEVLPYSSIKNDGRSELIAIFKKYLV